MSICLVPVYLFSGGKSHIVLGFYRDRRCPRWQVPCGPAGQSGVLCRAGFLPEGRCPIVGGAELSGLSSTCKEPGLGTSAWSTGLGCAERSRQASRCLFSPPFFLGLEKGSQAWACRQKGLTLMAKARVRLIFPFSVRYTSFKRKTKQDQEKGTSLPVCARSHLA